MELLAERFQAIDSGQSITPLRGYVSIMGVFEPIAGNALLSGLAPSELALLTPHLRKTIFDADRVLQEAEAPVDHVWFPLSGMISLVVVNSSATTVETAVIGREGVIGALAALGSWDALTRAVVQLRGHGLAISAKRFREIAHGSAHIRNLMLLYTEVLLTQVQQTAACNALHSLEQRLARWLLQAQDRVADKILALTQEFLAQMLGVRRTSITLAAQNLEMMGLIRYSRGRIEIIDRAGLEAMACECYAAIRRREVRFAQQILAAQTRTPERCTN